jgi:hypothetical protein
MKQSKLICLIIIMCTLTIRSMAQEPAKIDTTKHDVTNSLITGLTNHSSILSSNVVELLLKGPNVMYEQVISGNKGITAKLVYDISPSVDLLYLESSYRWYLWKPNGDRPLTGLYAAPFLKMTQRLGGDNLFTFGLGAEAGFKWIWYEHLEFEPAVVYSYPFGFDLHLSFGYAF